MQKKNNPNRNNVDEKTAFKKSFIKKVKEHKKEVIIVAITISLSIVTIYALKKRVVLKTQFEQVYTKNNERNNVIHVNEHFRNLSKGSKASIKQVKLAASQGYRLKNNQTFVNAYNKTSA